MNKKFIILLACLLYLALTYSNSFGSGGGDDYSSSDESIEDNNNNQFHDPMNEDTTKNTKSINENDNPETTSTNSSDQD